MTVETKAPAAKGSKPAKTKAKVERSVIHPEIQVAIAQGDNALTAEIAKEIMGWQTEAMLDEEVNAGKEEEKRKKVTFGSDYLLVDEEGSKVRCLNNTNNRPLSYAWARTLAQDILNKHWAGPRGNGLSINGESVVIGKTGTVLSAQHRLVALIIAEQMWRADTKEGEHWRTKWDTEPVLETLVVYGVDESPETTRTMDNVKPRTLADVLFSDHDIFASADRSDRTKLCRMVDYAVKLLWSRTGAGLDAFAPRRTHSEALDFLSRHPRLLRAVKHVFDEDQQEKDDEGKKLPPPIGRWVSPGYASALLYLMGSSTSEAEKYTRQDPPSEKALKWDNWDKACEFWVLLGKGAKELKEVRYAIGSLASPDGDTGRGSLAEVLAVLAKAWRIFSKGRDPGKVDLKLNYTEKHGVTRLDDNPLFGGIDIGDPKLVEPPEEEEAEEEEVPDLEVKKANERKNRQETANKKGAEEKEKKEAKRVERNSKKRGVPILGDGDENPASNRPGHAPAGASEDDFEEEVEQDVGEATEAGEEAEDEE